MRLSEFGHSTEFSFREDWSVMTHKVGPDDACGAYSNSALEHAFEADLDMASLLHREIIDHFHHRLGPTRIDCVKLILSQNVFDDFRNSIPFPKRSIVGCEQ